MAPTATNNTNGQNATTSSPSSTYLSKNPEVAQFSQFCQSNSGKNANPRAKEVMDSLMAHLHAWFDEVKVTPEEFLMGCNALAKAGRMCDDKRNEFILLGDIMGLETLADTMAYEEARKQASAGKVEGKGGQATKSLPTSSAILGPFFRENAPEYAMGHDIVQDRSTRNHEGKQGESTFMFGTLTDVDGKPIEGATIDVWHDAINGLYEQQDPNQPEYNCRGKFTTGADGKYSYKCLKPVAYPIPYDSTSGDLLKLLDRSPMRQVIFIYSFVQKAFNLLSLKSLIVLALIYRMIQSLQQRMISLSILSKQVTLKQKIVFGNYHTIFVWSNKFK
ncbi:hypothetical protein L7F22_067835 [Adiantum nelumboides]|nr:hypothetical protein [Adiantum nelumboides]